MNVLLCLSLWLALMVLSCCGDVGSDETEEPPTDYYDDLTVTPTPDYDYNATFDYYFVTGIYHQKGPNEEGEETQNHLPKGDVGSDETEEPPTDYYDDSTVTPTPDYDYNATFDYEFVTGIYHQKGPNEEGEETQNHLPKVDGSTGIRGKASGIGRWSPILLLGLALLLIWH